MDNEKRSRRRRATGEQATISGDSPVRKPMAAQMHVELVVNDDAEVWVLHDKPFPAILQWAEYDEESNMLSFVTHDGKVQDLGIIIPEKIADILLDARRVFAMYMPKGQIADMGIVPVMVRETVFH